MLFAAVFTFSCSKGAPEVPGMVHVPGGAFTMGSEEKDTAALGVEFGLRSGKFFENEAPVHKVDIDGYYIDKYEVTNAEYRDFINAVSYKYIPTTWENGKYQEKLGRHPVAGVTWYDAANYCTWAGKRLPTEAEWEKAARGPNGNVYPWGNDFDQKKANLVSGESVEVGSAQTDKSPYGVFDMAGNVAEWVDDWYLAYPGNKSQSKEYGEQYKVFRGGEGTSTGHYALPKIYARGSARRYYLPGGAGGDVGFRCAKSAEGK